MGTRMKQISNSLPLLTGTAASIGTVSGKVRVVRTMEDLHGVQQGDILVAEKTSPDFVIVFKKINGIITDSGGSTSHAAIIARELGIPAVVGTENATQVLHDGQVVTIDGGAGKVYEGDISLGTITRISSFSPIQSTGNDIDDLVNAITGGINEVSELWPLKPLQLLGYIDVDQCLDMYTKLKSLVNQGMSFQEIAKLFEYPSKIRLFLINSGLTGLKAAQKLDIGAISTADQIQFTEWMIQILKELTVEDPLCMQGKNILFNNNQVGEFVKSHHFESETDEMKEALSLLSTSLIALTWSFYWDYFPETGSETHGVYDVSKQFGNASSLLVKDYFNISPYEIWPYAKDIPVKSIVLSQIYCTNEIYLNFGNRIVNNNNIGELATHYSLQFDGKNITSSEAIYQLIEVINSVAKKQTEIVNSLDDLEKVRFGTRLAYYARKEFYLHFNSDWYPEEMVEKTLQKLGRTFIDIYRNEPNRSLDFKKKLYDPRNTILP